MLLGCRICFLQLVAIFWTTFELMVGVMMVHPAILKWWKLNKSSLDEVIHTSQVLRPISIASKVACKLTVFHWLLTAADVIRQHTLLIDESTSYHWEFPTILLCLVIRYVCLFQPQSFVITTAISNSMKTSHAIFGYIIVAQVKFLKVTDKKW